MKKVLIAYFSLTGNTGQMADYIAEGVRISGQQATVKKIADIKKAADLEGYDGYIFGSPTYHRDMAEPMKTFLFLARQANLRLRMEPGVLKGLPAQTRQNFGMMMQSATIRTALEMISAMTGLAYEVTLQEIFIKHTETTKALATNPAKLPPAQMGEGDERSRRSRRNCYRPRFGLRRGRGRGSPDAQLESGRLSGRHRRGPRR